MKQTLSGPRQWRRQWLSDLWALLGTVFTGVTAVSALVVVLMTSAQSVSVPLPVKRHFINYLLLFSVFEEPVRAAVLGAKEEAPPLWVNGSARALGSLGGTGHHRRLTTDVSTFSGLSSAITSGAQVNVVSDITFTSVITISGVTDATVSSSTGAVLTSNRGFSASHGGMFYIESGSDVTFTGLGFASGSASIRGGCFYVTGSTVEMEDVDFTKCYAGVSRLKSEMHVLRPSALLPKLACAVRTNIALHA